jgi:hypothetical protein
MRRFLMVAVIFLGAGLAQGQVLWIGAGSGTSWEWQAPTAAGQTWLHGSDQAPNVWLALPLSEGTLLRLRAADMPHDMRLLTGTVGGTLRSYTLGIDYTVPDSIGDASF